MDKEMIKPFGASEARAVWETAMLMYITTKTDSTRKLHTCAAEKQTRKITGSAARIIRVNMRLALMMAANGWIR